MNEKTKAQDELTKRTCAGAYLAISDGALLYSAYPFMLHEVFVLPWNIHIVDHHMSIQLVSCTRVREELSELCWGCSQLLTHQIVKAILHQMKNGIHINTNYAYQPIGGLIKVLNKKCAGFDGLHFKQLLTLQTMARWAQTVGQYELLVMAMSEGKVNCLDILLQAGHNHGVGVRGMMEMLDHARKGLYRPKTYTEENMSHGLLFLRLGGAHLARLAHQTIGNLSHSTLPYETCANSAVTSLSPSAWFPTKSEILHNIWPAFKNLHGNAGCGYVLMIDKIKVEKRLQWDPSTNMILGLCQEHTEHVNLDFCSMSNPSALVHSILCGEIHHASKVSHNLINNISIANKGTLLSMPASNCFLN